MWNNFRLFGIALCLIGIALFFYSLVSGDHSWLGPGGSLSAAGAVLIIAAAHRSRPG